MATPELKGPAFDHLPSWVKARLRPIAIEKIKAVYDWVENECIPREPVMAAQLQSKKWGTPPLMQELRNKAKEKGLFNLFLPNHFKESPGLTNLEYACCAEIMGRTYWAAQVNLNAFDATILQSLIVSTDHELPCTRDWQHGTPGQVLY